MMYIRTFTPEGMVCVNGGVAPPSGDTSCGATPGTLGLDNIFRADGVVADGEVDSYLPIVKKLTVTGSGTTTSPFTQTKIIDDTNWD